MYPSLDLLSQSKHRSTRATNHTETIEAALADFKCPGKVIGESHGPVLSTYKVKLNPGIRFATLNNRSVDLALSLGALSIRLTPNGDHIAMEVPNEDRAPIALRDIAQQLFQLNTGLALALGKDLRGLPYILDLCRAPHILVAGQTGAGKSVCINSMLISLLLKNNPDQLKLVLVDPKRVELGLYAELPHLSRKIAVEYDQAIAALKYLISEMESRYKLLADCGARNIHEYRESGHQMPYIVTFIDEMADLMIISKGEAELLLTRLAQMARAVGIHLVLATQRPSVDVITGLIKANVPTRIGLRVASKTDSRVILDTNGAECLLGQGDMLLIPPDTPHPIRLHGPFVSSGEVKRVVSFWKQNWVMPVVPVAEPEPDDYATTIALKWIEQSGGQLDVFRLSQVLHIEHEKMLEVAMKLTYRKILKSYNPDTGLHYTTHQKGKNVINHYL